MTEEKQYNLDDAKPDKISLSIKKYEGTKTKVKDVKIIVGTSSYNESGEKVEGLKREVPKLKIISEDIEPNGNVEVLMPMFFDDDGQPKWKTGEKSKIQQMLNKFEIAHPKEMIGKEVVLGVYVSQKDPSKRSLTMNLF